MRSARPPPERLLRPADRPGCYRTDGGHRCHSRLCQALPGCAADVSVVLFLGDDVSAIELFSPSPARATSLRERGMQPVLTCEWLQRGEELRPEPGLQDRQASQQSLRSGRG